VSVYTTSEADVVTPQSFETRSFDWKERGSHKTALFRLYPGGHGVLQHVRTATVDRGPGPSRCEIDTEPDVRDVDERILAELRGRGFDVVAGRSR
jgi:hypothetical protein